MYKNLFLFVALTFNNFKLMMIREKLTFKYVKAIDEKLEFNLSSKF